MDFEKLESALKDITDEIKKTNEQFYKEVAHEIFEVVNGAKLRWTKEQPKVPGFYWITLGNGMVVEVCKNNKGELVVFYPGSKIEDDISCLGDYEWAGPIPKPQDAE